MSNNKTSLTRKVETQLTDNGTPFAYSMTSHKNIKVNAEVQPPLQLPGLIIFVHGVNSEGEWYNNAEVALCSGLNQRLGLQEQYSLIANEYYDGIFESCEKNSSEWAACYGDDNKENGYLLLVRLKMKAAHRLSASTGVIVPPITKPITMPFR
jgi:hypothetical protein